ncbi:MAG: hypothetical protein Fur0043_22390 [Anaerolineales bacterium]
MRAYKERASMRGLERIFNIARQTVARWIREIVRTLPDLKDTLLPAEPNDVLELDELWSFVLKKSEKRWLWTAICRRTRQIVAFVIGDRSVRTCRRLWNKIPDGYKKCLTFSDFWEAYQKVFSKKTHRCVGKDSGETVHMERWYNTLRQRLARFVCKTLSFSKSDAYHHMVTKWYIAEYNQTISLTNVTTTALVNYILTIAPRIIVLGGGVMQKSFLYEAIRARVHELLHDYLPHETLTRRLETYIVPPALGNRSGVLGGIALAIAAEGSSNT